MEIILLPRGLLVAGAFWVVVAWVTTMGVSPPVVPSAASYTPAVRMMFLLVALGLFVAWPLVRLSGPMRRRAVAFTMLDLTVLISLMHVVVWPLRLVTTWPPMRMLAVSTVLATWTILAAAVVAWGIRGDSPWRRLVAMMACLMIAGIGPLWWALAVPAGSELGPFDMPIWGGPLLELHRVGTAAGPLPIDLWVRAGCVAIVGMMLLVASGLRRGVADAAPTPALAVVEG